MVGVLAEAEYQEQDRRHWLLAQKFGDPFAAYKELRDSIERSIDSALEPKVDERTDIPDWQRKWYKA